MNQFEEIVAFVRIVESGGISRAAEQMQIAKSAVSRRLNNLEARLGQRLLLRTTRAIKLTDLGEDYYQRSLRVLNDLEELDSIAKVENLTGKLKIAAPLSFSLEHLSPAIDDFLTVYPKVDFDLNLSDRHIDLVEEGVDLAIRIGELQDSTLIAKKLTNIHALACASPNYLEKYGKPKQPQDLVNHKVLHYSGSRSTQLKFYDENKKPVSVKVTASMSANNGDFLKKAALQDRGIIISPTFICWKELKEKSLVPILENFSNRSLNCYAVYPSGRFLKPTARTFIDFLKDRFGDTPYWDNY